MEIDFFRHAMDMAYSILIIISCAYIYAKTRKLYYLSGHKGIRLLRTAFFYWGIAFLLRLAYSAAEPYMAPSTPVFLSTYILFTFFSSIAGLYLVYSLVWKETGEAIENYLIIAALLGSLLDIYFMPNAMLYIMIAVLGYGATVSYSNYKEAGKEYGFLQMHFIALVTALLTYITNLVAVFAASYFPEIVYYASAINLLTILIFLWGIVKFIKWPRKEKDLK
jgi:hypothetical protein